MVLIENGLWLLLLLGFWWRELGGPCSTGALPSDIPQIPVSVQAGVGSQTRFRPGFVPRKMCHLAVFWKGCSFCHKQFGFNVDASRLLAKVARVYSLPVVTLRVCKTLGFQRHRQRPLHNHMLLMFQIQYLHSPKHMLASIFEQAMPVLSSSCIRYKKTTAKLWYWYHSVLRF